MKITDILPNNLILSPLAGYTDAGFRYLAKKYGCGLTVTEMVSAKAMSMNNVLTDELLYTRESGVKAVQLFGHEVEAFRQVANNPKLAKFDIIDINAGCPMRKIVGNGDGSALMTNPKLAGDIIRAVKSSGKYVTIKFRTGITDSSLAVDFAKYCEDAGADMLTVHGRTRDQLYSGQADWDTIAEVVRAVNIPVVANGDIVDKASYDSVMAHTHCYGVAIGRGSMGKPYIFADILEMPYSYDILTDYTEHVNILKEYLPEPVVVNEMKKHLCCYVKGIRGNKQFVVKATLARSIVEMTQLLTDFLSND